MKHLAWFPLIVATLLSAQEPRGAIGLSRGPQKVTEANAWSFVEDDAWILDACEAASKGIEALPASAKESAVTGVELLVAREHYDALKSFESATAAVPTSASAHWLAAMAAHRLGSLTKARRHLESAVGADPKIAGIWTALGRIDTLLEADAVAGKAFDESEKLDPASPRVHVFRADLHRSAGRVEEAKQELAKALAKRARPETIKNMQASLDRLAKKPDWKVSFKRANDSYSVETPVSQKLADDVAQRLAVYRGHLEKAFPLAAAKAAAPSRVWIFDSDEQFQALEGSRWGARGNYAASYNPLIKTLLLTKSITNRHADLWLLHQAFLQYLDLAVSRPPAWMSAGLAEYFAQTTFDATGQAKEGGLSHVGVDYLRSMLIPMKSVMKMKMGELTHIPTGGRPTAQSWGFVHFFRQSEDAEARKLFTEYCDAVIAGKTQEEAFGATFGKDGGAGLEAMEGRFKAYAAELVRRSRAK